MILVFDAGNSRTTWGVFDAQGALIAQGAEDNARLDLLVRHVEAWAGCRKLLVSSVAGPAVDGVLQGIAGTLGLPLHLVRPGIEAGGVRNGYAIPGRLGSDRWLALIAAWQRYRAPCVLATAGTALTVDCLSSHGEFLGGLIVPGLQLMQQSLHHGTAGLQAATGAWSVFPTTTADAMVSGALNASAGAVERMHAALQEREGRPVRCLVAGGDADRLAAALHMPCEILDNPVLQGLYLIESEYA